MENIIKKAIEGGFEAYQPLENYTAHCFKCEYVCDPIFWQALGKACGWDKNGSRTTHESYETEKYGVIEYYDVENWEYYALRFHEINLTEGWDKAVEYLQEITNTKEV